MLDPDADVLEGLTQKQRDYFRRGHRMAVRSPRGTRAFCKANRFVFRLTGGRVGGRLLGLPVGLLTTTGRRSGQTRTVPIVYLDEGVRFLVASQNSGLDASPAWYLNLRANPKAEMQTRAGTGPVVARELIGSERDEGWRRLLAHNPLLDAYQSCTERQFAIIALERRQNQESG